MDVDVVGVSLERAELRLTSPRLRVYTHLGAVHLELPREDLVWLAQVLVEDNFHGFGLPPDQKERVEGLTSEVNELSRDLDATRRAADLFKKGADAAVAHLSRRVAELEATVAAFTLKEGRSGE